MDINERMKILTEMYAMMCRLQENSVSVCEDINCSKCPFGSYAGDCGDACPRDM